MERGYLRHWQPTTWLGGRASYEWHFKEIVRHEEALRITICGQEGRLLDIIFDDPERKCPLEYVVWAFRYGTEMGNLFITPNFDEKKPKNIKGATFFKVENSPWVRLFDTNHLANRFLYPDVQHFVFATGDEEFEVIANYEPRFAERFENPT